MSLASLAIACVAFLASPRAPFVASLEVAAAGSPPPGRYIVPLHRQRVPVQSEADTVSYKSVYFGTISVGAPQKQEFSVVFDTGSGHVVIPSQHCHSETCLVHRRYSREASLHAVDVDYDGTPVKPGAPRDQITVAFGTGEVTGQFVNDRLCLGPAEDGRLAATPGATGAPAAEPQVNPEDRDRDRTNCVEIRLVTATEMTHEPFHAFSFDGVLGLGLDGLALAPEFSFFGMMTKQRRLQQPSFGVFLADSDEEFSEISFGGHSPELVRSGLQWAPVAFPELGYWQVHIKHMRIGNRTVDFCEDGTCRAVVDTGTSLLAVPRDFADELQAELEGPLRDPAPSPEDGDVDCKLAEGALVHFDLGDFTLTLAPGDYARQSIHLQDEAVEAEPEATRTAAEAAGTAAPASAPQQEAAGAAAPAPAPQQEAQPLSWENAPRSCRPTLMPIDLPEPLGPKLFIWGEPVLRKYYTVYNWETKQIGFGLAAHTSDEAVETTTVAPTTTKAPPKKPLLRPLLL